MRLKPEGVPCNRCTVWYCSAMQAVFFRRSIFTRAMLFCSSASVFSYEGGKYLIMSLEAGESQQMKKSKPFFRWTDHSKIHNLSKDLSYTVTPHSQSFWKLCLGKAFTNAWWWLREIKKKKKLGIQVATRRMTGWPSTTVSFCPQRLVIWKPCIFQMSKMDRLPPPL